MALMHYRRQSSQAEGTLHARTPTGAVQLSQLTVTTFSSHSLKERPVPDAFAYRPNSCLVRASRWASANRSVLCRAPTRCFRDAVVLLVGNQTVHLGRQTRLKGISVVYSRISRS